jgi:hypothetical protein
MTKPTPFGAFFQPFNLGIARAMVGQDFLLGYNSVYFSGKEASFQCVA